MVLFVNLAILLKLYMEVLNSEYAVDFQESGRPRIYKGCFNIATAV